MSQSVTIDRFCAIEDVYCTKTIPFNGPGTFFFAYPSSLRMNSFSSELVDELGERGINGTRWEDIVGAGLLFSKVCEGIYSNDFLLAEVTEPNSNVLLEIGYALAVGRQPILLKNKNQPNWSRYLLTTLESCFYQTRDDINEFILTWQSQSAIPSDPARRLPLLENMGFFDNQEVRGTAYHLKPRMSTDWISRVDKTFNRSYFDLHSMDPSDSVYDEFFPQARQIQRASLVVASFASKNNINWEESNANVALLTGFAIGLGKPVLVLQEEPMAPILDLGSVSRTFEAENQVKMIVEAWIDKQVQLSVKQNLESRKQASSRERADYLRNVYLGHPDALQDSELLDYFIPTKEFDDAIQGRRTIFIGRRGSGKSANFQAIKANVADRKNVIGVEISPDDFQLERITTFLERALDLQNPQLIFQNVWNYVLVSEMLKSLAENTDLLYFSPDDLARNNLREIYETTYDDLALDFGNRVVSVLERVILSDSSLTPEDRQLNAESSIQSLRKYDLGRRISDFASEEEITFFVVADDLDKHWRPNTGQSNDLLVGLVAEVARMQRFFGKHLKIVLFLREDIYDVLTRYDDDLSKRDILRMEWTSTNLKHLVAERLAIKAGEVNEDDEDTWAAIFPEPVKNRPASDYILSRSLPRPRDVLNLCQKAIDQAQRNGHSYVDAEDILQGERSFSEALFYAVSSEFKGIYPDLGEVLIEFGSVAEKLPWQEFEYVAKKAIRNNEKILNNWIGMDETTPHQLAEVLFRIGLIGLSREWTGTIHYCNGRSYADTWALVSSSPVVHIHPAFVQFLDISEAVLRPPQKARRRRGDVSPLQMSFEDKPD